MFRRRRVGPPPPPPPPNFNPPPRPQPNDEDPIPGSRLRRQILLWLGLALLLVPINAWAAYDFSFHVLLDGYIIIFSSSMYCLAWAILLAGIILPPAALAAWIWDLARYVDGRAETINPAAADELWADEPGANELQR